MLTNLLVLLVLMARIAGVHRVLQGFGILVEVTGISVLVRPRLAGVSAHGRTLPSYAVVICQRVWRTGLSPQRG